MVATAAIIASLPQRRCNSVAQIKSQHGKGICTLQLVPEFLEAARLCTGQMQRRHPRRCSYACAVAGMALVPHSLCRVPQLISEIVILCFLISDCTAWYGE